MTKFFVGQKVRLVRAKHSCNQGATGVITHLGNWQPGDCMPCGYTAAFPFNAVVYFDRSVKIEITFGYEYACHVATVTSKLEPILDQHQPCDTEFKESLDNLLEGLPA